MALLLSQMRRHMIKFVLSYNVAVIQWITSFLICFPMNYRDFSVKITGENYSKITTFIFIVCKKRRFYEFLAKSLAQKV